MLTRVKQDDNFELLINLVWCWIVALFSCAHDSLR
jgi:hypothetical protein